MIAQGGVKLNGAPTADIDVPRASLDDALRQVESANLCDCAPSERSCLTPL